MTKNVLAQNFKKTCMRANQIFFQRVSHSYGGIRAKIKCALPLLK